MCKNAATSTCACLGGGEYCAPLNRCCDPGQRCEDGECVRRTCRGGGKKACLKLAQDTYDLKVEKVYNYKRWSYKGPSTQRDGAEYFALSGQVQAQWTLKDSIAECEMWCTTP